VRRCPGDAPTQAADIQARSFMGFRRGREGGPRKRVVNLRFTEAEYADLMAESIRVGVGLNDHCRKILLAALGGS